MAWGARELQHRPTVLQFTARTVDDHVKTAIPKLRKLLGLTAIAAQVLHPCRDRLFAPGKQGELVARHQQLAHQRFTDETGATHHQDFHQQCPQARAIQAGRAAGKIGVSHT